MRVPASPARPRGAHPLLPAGAWLRGAPACLPEDSFPSHSELKTKHSALPPPSRKCALKEERAGGKERTRKPSSFPSAWSLPTLPWEASRQMRTSCQGRQVLGAEPMRSPYSPPHPEPDRRGLHQTPPRRPCQQPRWKRDSPLCCLHSGHERPQSPCTHSDHYTALPSISGQSPAGGRCRLGQVRLRTEPTV